MAISVDDLADVISKELADYKQDVTDDLKKSVKDAAKVCVSELKATSPEATGFYKSGWRSKTAFESMEDIRIVVHNSKAYQLTHLLEYGHALVTGGRVPAHPHIAQAEENAAEVLEKDIKIKVGSR